MGEGVGEGEGEVVGQLGSSSVGGAVKGLSRI